MTVHGTFTTLVPWYLYRTKSSFVRCRRSKVNTARLHSLEPSQPNSLLILTNVSLLLTTVSPLWNRYVRLNFPHVPRARSSHEICRPVTKVVSYFLQKCYRKTRMYGEEKKLGITRDRKVAYNVPPWISWQGNHSSLSFFFSASAWKMSIPRAIYRDTTSQNYI